MIYFDHECSNVRTILLFCVRYAHQAGQIATILDKSVELEILVFVAQSLQVALKVRATDNYGATTVVGME